MSGDEGALGAGYANAELDTDAADSGDREAGVSGVEDAGDGDASE